MRLLILTFLLTTTLASPADTQLTFASPFTDHAVLQRDQPIPIWGKATPGREIEVSFSEQTATTTADANGRWKLTLAPLPGSSIPTDLIASTGDETITREDIVVGEVWICSGQSNMQMGQQNVPELDGLSEEGIRTLEVKRSVAFNEQASFDGSWQVAGPQSAVAFGFAHHLRKQTEFPVGIILAAWGSTSIEAWMPRDLSLIHI